MYFSTGQTARELGVTQARIRALCHAEAIPAEVTEGGQFRISTPVVEELKAKGLPPLPKPMPQSNDEPEDAAPSRSNGRAAPVALSEPSQAVTAAAEHVAVLEKEVEAVGLLREKEEALLLLSSTRQAAKKKAAEERALSKRQRWEDRWQQFGIVLSPPDAPPELQIQLPARIKEALRDVNASQADNITERLVRAATEITFAPWVQRKEKAIRDTVEDAVNLLLRDAGELPNPAEWRSRAKQAAHEAIHQLGDRAPALKIVTVACQAVQRVAHEFEHIKKCIRIVNRVRIDLRNATTEERKEAEESVLRAVGALPFGTHQRELEQARDSVLTPIQARIDERLTREREEQARKEDQRTRNLLAWQMLSLRYPKTDR